MKDEGKTKEQLVNELVEMRQRIAELEASEVGRKRAEEELREYRDHLEELVKERTIELTTANDQFQREITEHRQAEESLKRSEEKFARAFHRGPTLMTISAIEDGNYIEVNDNFVRITGYSRKESIGTTSVNLGFISPKDRDKLKQELIKNGRVDGMELTLHKKNGDTLYCLYFGEVIAISGKQRLLSIASDITARKRVEQVLRESEERFREMASLLPQVVGETDLRGNFTFVNQNAFQMFGYTQKDFEKGVNILQVLIPEDHERVKEGIQKVLKGERPERNEYTAIRKDGSTFPILVYSCPAIRQNKPAGMISIVVDITEQKRAEEALRRERDRAQKYLDVAGVMLVALNEKGEITLMNRKGHRVLGYREGDLVGRNWFDTCLPAHAREDTKLVLQQLMAGDIEPVETHENPILTESGEERIIAWYNTVLTDETGKISGILSSGEDITARKRAEEALRRERDFAESLIETAQVIVLVLDTEGQIVRFNPYTEEIAGYDLEKVRGKDWFTTFLPKRDQGRIKELFLRAVSDIHTGGNVNPIVTKDGRELEIEWYDKTLKDAGGNIVGFLAIGQDITKRVRAEESLERRATQLALLNDVGARIAAVLELDILLDGTARLVQEGFGYHHVGLFTLDRERGELVMKARAGDFNAFFPPEHRIKLGQGVVGWVGRHGERLLANDVDDEPRYINFYPDVIPARSELGVPIRVGGEVVGVLDVQSPSLDAFDESDVMVMETLASQLAVAIENARLMEGLEALVAARTAEIVAEQEKSEAILRSVDDAIAMSDLEMRLRYVNPAFTALTGYTAQEAIGQLVSFLFRQTMSEQDRQSLRLSLSQGDVWRGEVSSQRKDGRPYEASMTLVPLRDGEGRLTGYVSSHRDISQRRELERARSRFVTNVSHELRTPVANMKLYANLLRMGRRPEKIQRYAQVIEEQADRLAELVQDILEMTELDSGQAVMAWKPVSLPTIIGDTVTRYQSRAEASGLTLVAKPVPPDLPVVRGDQSRLSQALGELVENAVIFTPAGGQVTVETGTTETEEQLWVTVAVHDTGPGISPEEQERVFDRFFRGSLAESGHVPGTGMGLSFAREIVRAHGGRVTVESKIGEGSTFTLWLPPGD